jgi:hypothetical protein
MNLAGGVGGVLELVGAVGLARGVFNALTLNHRKPAVKVNGVFEVDERLE